MIGGAMRMFSAYSTSQKANNVEGEWDWLEESVTAYQHEARGAFETSRVLAAENLEYFLTLPWVPSLDEALLREIRESVVVDGLSFKFYESGEFAFHKILIESAPDWPEIEPLELRVKLASVLGTLGLSIATIELLNLAIQAGDVASTGFHVGEAVAHGADLLDTQDVAGAALDLVGGFEPVTLALSAGLAIWGRKMQKNSKEKLDRVVKKVEVGMPRVENAYMEAELTQSLADIATACVQAINPAIYFLSMPGSPSFPSKFRWFKRRTAMNAVLLAGLLTMLNRDLNQTYSQVQLKRLDTTVRGAWEIYTFCENARLRATRKLVAVRWSVISIIALSGFGLANFVF